MEMDILLTEEEPSTIYTLPRTAPSNGMSYASAHQKRVEVVFQTLARGFRSCINHYQSEATRIKSEIANAKLSGDSLKAYNDAMLKLLNCWRL
ncbi:unnamed protein product [Caenorhabditis brenneri]